MICDLAQYYGIYDYTEMPICLIGTLVVGLPDDSRTKKSLSGMRVDVDTLLLGIIADKLSFIAWSKTKDAEKGRNRPESMTAMLLGKNQKESEIMAFNSAEDFEKARQRILNGD